MLRTRTIGAFGAGALAFLLLSPQAFAQCATNVNDCTFTNGNIVTYAVEAVSTSGGNLTIPAAPVWVSPVTTAAIPGGGGSFLITFSLPTGVSFASNAPSATVASTGAICNPNNTLAATGGGIGSSFVTFTIGVNAGAAAGGTCSVTLNAIVVSGATALTTATTSPNDNTGKGFVISEQVSGSTGIVTGANSTSGSFNQAKAVPVGLASSATQLVYVTTAGYNLANPDVVIDIGPKGLGAAFQPLAGDACGGAGGVDQSCADLGAINPGAANFQNATATGIFTFTGTSATVTINGNFGGIASAWLTTPSNAAGAQAKCSATSTAAAAQVGAIQGVVKANSLVFAGINGTVNGGTANNPWDITKKGYGGGGAAPPTATTTVFQEVCVYAAGAPNVIANNPNGFTSTASIDTSTTTDLAKALVGYTYNGAVQDALYIPSTSGSYPTFLRVVNHNNTSATVIALLQSELGATANTTVALTGATSVPANNNILVPVATIVSNSGITLDATKRASLRILSPPGVAASLLMINPDGTVTQLGSGCAGQPTGGAC